MSIGLFSVDVTDEGESVAFGRFREPLDFGQGPVTPEAEGAFLIRLAR